MHVIQRPDNRDGSASVQIDAFSAQDVVDGNRERNMGQLEDMSEWLSPAEQAVRMPVA